MSRQRRTYPMTQKIPVSGIAVEAGYFVLSDQARTQPCGSMLMCSEPPTSWRF